MEEMHAREKELIEAAKQKLMEEVQAMAAKFHEENEKEMEKIRAQHKKLTEGLAEEVKALQSIDEALQEHGGEATAE